MSKSNPNASKRLALIASKGTLDWAYPPFILASAAGAMGWEVGVFFTFYGLTLLKPELTAAVSPLGNPAMPMKMPVPVIFLSAANANEALNAPANSAMSRIREVWNFA